MRVFLDANILFTAVATPDGWSALLIDNARKGGIPLVTCDLAVEEAGRNLRAKAPARADSLASLLGQFEIVPTVATGKCPVDLPEQDVSILLSAMAAQATHLVTGDFKDFGRWMNNPRRTGGVVIQSVADFLRSV
ncbi:MAG: PIN domain-containing protein [Candidatus Coatesbacteria bacterium]